MIRVTCVVGVFLVSGAAGAFTLTGEAGKHYSNLGFGGSTSQPGMRFNGHWAHRDHNGNAGSLGLDYRLPIGGLTVTLGGKALYLRPHEGKSGGALAMGGGLHWPLNRYFSVYGNGYFAPSSLTTGVRAYHEAGGALRWNVVRTLNLDVGYRYMQMEGKSGRRHSTLADGPYVGVGMRF